jgi:hypothetical protein
LGWEQEAEEVEEAAAAGIVSVAAFSRGGRGL